MSEDVDISEIQMLALVKILYERGERQCRMPLPANTLAILDFHDAVELFLNLAVDHLKCRKERPTEQIKFMAYWKMINSELENEGKAIRHETTMEKLNNARVNLKHHCNLTQTISIEAHRVNTRDFLEESVPIIFGLDFNSISLVSAVSFEGTRDKLHEGEEEIKKGELRRIIGFICHCI